MKENYKDVTGTELQGCFGSDYCEGIDKPGKYTIRVIDNRFDDNVYKDPILGPLAKKMDELTYGTKEYEAVEAEYFKTCDEKFGKDSDAWKPTNVEIIEIYSINVNGELKAHVIFTNKKWYYYNGNHRCFKPFENSQEAKNYINQYNKLVLVK